MMQTEQLRRIWLWIIGQIIQTVPKDIAVCEFECRKNECTFENWETCENRLGTAARAPNKAQ